MNGSEFEDAYDDKRRIRGEILTITIADLKPREPVFVEVGSSAAAAVRAMNEHHVGCVLVLQGGKLVGIFTERDVLTRVVFHDQERALKVEQVMTRNPETLTAADTIVYALNIMSEGGFRHIPIVNREGKPIGTVAMRHIVDFLVDLFPDDVYNLPPTPAQGIARTVDGG